jgi:O-antigen ligase
MDDVDAAHAAAVLGAIGAPLVLLARGRATLFGGFAALGVAEATLVLSRASDVLRPATLSLGLAALVVFGAGAVGFVRRPDLVVPVVLVAAPFRLPLDFGGEHRFFVAIAEAGDLGRLHALYAVLGAAALALLWRTARGGHVAALPPAVAAPSAALIAFASLSLLWSSALDAATNLLAFFLLPFAVLLACVGRAPFPPWLPRVLGWLAVALASLFAVVGLVEAATRDLLFSAPAVDVGNEYRSFFRVTSLFRDPSLYGRHVVLGMVVLVIAVLLRRVDPRPAAAVLAVLWAGLYFSYSQSSMAALFVAVLSVGLVASARRVRLVVTAAALALVLVGAGLVGAEVRDESARRATSGRSLRVEDTARVIAHHPVAGAGIGSQPLASRQLAERRGRLSAFVSHTTPLTIGAELGAVGLVLYLALLTGAAWAIEQVRRRDRALGLALAATLLVLFVHSLAYSGFFEDPITWFVLGAASSFLVREGGGTPAAAPPGRAQPAEPLP